MNEQKTEQKKKLPFFGVGKMLPYLKKYRMQFTVMIGCSLLASMMDVFLPLIQRYALNHFVEGNTLDTLPQFILIYLAAVLFTAVMFFIYSRLATCIEVWVGRDLRNAAFSHLQTLSFSYFNQNSVGYIHSRVISDTGRIGSLFSWTLQTGVWEISYLLGAIVVMMVVNLKLALMVMIILPLIALLFSVFQKQLLKVNREIREVNSKIVGDFNEGITGAKTVKTLVIEDSMEARFRADTGEMRKKSVRASHLRGLFAATMNLASSLALAIVLWRGGYIAESEVGTFSMFMSYAQGMMEPVRWLIDAISDLITTQVNIERYSRLLETRSDVTDTPEVIAHRLEVFEAKTRPMLDYYAEREELITVDGARPVPEVAWSITVQLQQLRRRAQSAGA